jgi:hypothetical protein
MWQYRLEPYWRPRMSNGSKEAPEHRQKLADDDRERQPSEPAEDKRHSDKNTTVIHDKSSVCIVIGRPRESTPKYFVAVTRYPA